MQTTKHLLLLTLATAYSCTSPAQADTPPAVSPLNVPVGQMHLAGVTLASAIAQLQAKSAATILINWNVLRPLHVTEDLRVTANLSGLTVDQAIDRLLNEVGGSTLRLGYVVDDGVITISTLKDLSNNVETRTYDIRSAIKSVASRQADVAAIIERVRGLDPLSWRDTGSGQWGTVHEMGGQLIVTQTPAIHARIVAELKDAFAPTAQ